MSDSARVRFFAIMGSGFVGLAVWGPDLAWWGRVLQLVAGTLQFASAAVILARLGEPEGASR